MSGVEVGRLCRASVSGVWVGCQGLASRFGVKVGRLCRASRSGVKVGRRGWVSRLGALVNLTPIPPTLGC